MRIAILLIALHGTAALAGDKWVGLTPYEQSIGRSSVVADPMAPNVLYGDDVIGFSRGLAKSTDGGRTWERLLTVDSVSEVVIAPSAPWVITALSLTINGWRIDRSRDGGRSWSHFQPKEEDDGLISDIAADSSNANVLYAAYENACAFSCNENWGGVSRSTDGGQHWSVVLKGISMDQVLVDPFRSETVYAVGSASAWRSSNAGATWTVLPDPAGHSIQLMALDPVLPDVLYASTHRGIWRSHNRGDTWESIGDPSQGRAARSIAVDPLHPGTIVIGVWNGGVWRTVDDGRTWQPINEGLAVRHAPWQLDVIRVFFAANGTLYGSGGFHGIMTLETPQPRRRASRH